MNESCPKCGAPKAEESCPKCGLMYEKYTPDKMDASVPETVRLLWENLEKNWGDKGAHALFVEQGIRKDAAGFVAACYRRRGEDPVAVEQLEELTGRLMQSLEFTPVKESTVSRHLRQVAYLLLFIIIAILVFLIFAHAMK
ncbi:MAG: hypothetical protein JXR76_27575 [Deltaproteobacteria bacterium]|nr:hypothetical protein [Deltaproteobacteria bacterium]